jgi:hypothetical protein
MITGWGWKPAIGQLEPKALLANTVDTGPLLPILLLEA